MVPLEVPAVGHASISMVLLWLGAGAVPSLAGAVLVAPSFCFVVFTFCVVDGWASLRAAHQSQCYIRSACLVVDDSIHAAVLHWFSAMFYSGLAFLQPAGSCSASSGPCQYGAAGGTCSRPCINQHGAAAVVGADAVPSLAVVPCLQLLRFPFTSFCGVLKDERRVVRLI
jgi:hypothetical protein